jgi:hypothetical protein
MPGLDQYGSFLIAALVITVLVLGGYLLYVWSRLQALRRRVAADQSDSNVSTAAPIPTTAHAASSANGPSTS